MATGIIHREETPQINGAPLTKRLVSVDCLRAVAALGVLFHHAAGQAWLSPEQPLWLRGPGHVAHYGNFGVPLFFVLSGFCIHLQWLRKQAAGAAPGFCAFWRRRLWRLYPPYFIVLCGSIALVVGAALKGAQLGIVKDYPNPPLPWIGLDFVTHALMLHGLIPAFDLKGGNPAFWTLAREEYFYLLYFVLLFMTRRWGVWRTGALVFGLGVAFYYLSQPVLDSHPDWGCVLLNSAIVLWIQWYLGLMAAEAYYGRLRLPRVLRTAWAIPPAVAAAVLIPRYVPALDAAVWGLVFFLLLNVCVQWEQRGRWPSGWPFSWLAGVGLMSYSLYLVHLPVCGVIRQALGARARTTDPATLVFHALVMIVAGYAVARIFFLLVERHFLVRKHAFPAQARDSAAG